ncbi:MAG: 4-hydroxy-3-methylbut-2-enyl diphosphate reductase [Planctomycetes bacterium]|nr:4-hydroxy-3-methylbut-2-enyl diphosphate reductase [Planctomycetota bacterium]MCH9727863.1 4-hydroxy-3-methylbut-2-enyl diphosphate reductase [Planctomycetota bacterium]MCH9775469.1 4-hydroxy-3-methylbut-2-enyl diphosphate reductase [Planctomycetota bacterium]MCH9792781.1 4-hydroxy-3-methylbut-2-enyl diphosphate reductase [Planctomycetota bacterium]
MKLILANPRGFCAGVNMAIECLEEVIRIFGSSIYVYHEIVHNKYVVNRFTNLGVTFVDTVDEVPENSILVFSAHGVSPAIRQEARERKIRTIDATCPLVTKVHMEAVKYAEAGYNIILIGHEGHDEVIGTMGEAPESITLIETPEEVKDLVFSEDDKLAYLTQTTLSVDEASRVIRALKEKYPHIESPPKEDICYATTNRQEAVSELVLKADLVLVLGSQNSSNSKRLMEIGKSAQKPAYLIDGVDELIPEWLAGCETILVTAGASAPEVVVQELVQHLEDHYQAEVENAVIREESVRFPLPKEIRSLQSK